MSECELQLLSNIPITTSTTDYYYRKHQVLVSYINIYLHIYSKRISLSNGNDGMEK